MKLTPVFDFTNVYEQLFAQENPESTKDSQVISVFLHFRDLLAQKLLVICW
jgi:hypothetical protein